MVVGVLKVKLAMRESRSLKDKRSLLRSLKEQLRNRFNVSLAEVDARDVRQLAVIALSQVGADARHVRSSLDKAVNVIREFAGAQLIDYSVEIFHD